MLDGNAGDVADRLGDYDLVVVDGEEASAAEVVGASRRRAPIVLAYLSVGTIEKWRGWYDDLKRYRLAAWQDWKDEWFADVSKAGLRDALADEIAPEILDKGFDGLFLDNVDMIEPKKHKQAARRHARACGSPRRPGRTRTTASCSPRTATGASRSSGSSTTAISTAGTART